MGLLSGWKSKRKGGEAEPAADAPSSAPQPTLHEIPPKPAHSTPSRGAKDNKGPGLREEVADLVTRGLERDEFAVAVVERIVASATMIEAAALLAYDPRENRLSISATHGLTPAAAAILAGATAEDGQGRWDIPLRGLLSRRINVIEAAHENPFVPQALKDVSPRHLTIVTIPFYHGPNPVGVALIFSPLEKGFSDLRLQQLTHAVRLCSPMFAEPDAVLGAPAPSQPRAGTPGALRKRLPPGVGEELARLKMALEEAERQRAAEAAERVTAESFLKVQQEKAAAVEQEIAALREEIERVRGSVGAVEARAADGAARLAAERDAAVEAARKAAEEKGRAAVDAVRAELAAAVARAERADQALADLARRRTDLESELTAVRADAEAQGKEAKALAKVRAERDGFARELEAAKTALKTAADESRAVAERLATREAEATQFEKELAGRLSALQRQLTETREEGTRTTNALAELRRETAAARERADQEAEARRAAEARVADLEMHLADAENERRAIGERLSGLGQSEEERTRLAGLVPELERQLAERQTAFDQIQRELAAKLTDVERSLGEQRSAREGAEEERRRAAEALEALRRDAANESERLRNEAAAEREAARSELAAAVEARARLEGELTHFRQAAEETRRELEIERTARAEVAAELERALADRLATTQSAETTAANLRRELDEANARIAALDLAARESSASGERLRSELEATSADRDRRLAEERTAREQTLAQASARIIELEAEAERRFAAEGEARRALEERIAGLEAEQARERAEWKETLERANADAEARISQLEASRKDAEEAYETELDDLRRELADKEEEITAAAKEFVLEELVEDVEEAELAIDRSAIPLDLTTESMPERPPPPAAVALPELVLIDDSAAGSAAAIALAEPERSASAVPPGPAGIEAMRSHPGAVVAINLAAPQILPTLRQIRANGTPSPRMFAYALSGANGFWLGPVGFAVLPFADLDIASLVRSAAPSAKRVIAMSADIDLMGNVRSRLAQAKISTAVVFDGRQALDLVPTVRPEAAIMHLAPSCGDVFSAVVGLRALEAARDIPIFFLIDSAPQQREEAFFATGLKLLATRSNLQATALRDQLAKVLISSPPGLRPTP